MLSRQPIFFSGDGYFPAVLCNSELMNLNADRQTPSPLPTVERRPNADVVIYDGNCGFCREGVERLDRMDRGNRLAFLSLHDPAAAELLPQTDHADLMKQMYVITKDGRKFGGADALKELSRKIPRLYWLAPLLHIPFSMPIWRWLYRIVARNRYRINKRVGRACETNACNIHFD